MNGKRKGTAETALLKSKMDARTKGGILPFSAFVNPLFLKKFLRKWFSKPVEYPFDSLPILVGTEEENRGKRWVNHLI